MNSQKKTEQRRVWGWKPNMKKTNQSKMALQERQTSSVADQIPSLYGPYRDPLYKDSEFGTLL